MARRMLQQQILLVFREIGHAFRRVGHSAPCPCRELVDQIVTGGDELFRRQLARCRKCRRVGRRSEVVPPTGEGGVDTRHGLRFWYGGGWR